ncbi:hypothetical protein FMGBMHLM_4472 [Methylobacterium aerolatum]|nr:hypothetical protein FMGBMHLM_4472 [Methylobacterium aerolatum]
MYLGAKSKSRLSKSPLCVYETSDYDRKPASLLTCPPSAWLAHHRRGLAGGPGTGAPRPGRRQPETGNDDDGRHPRPPDGRCPRRAGAAAGPGADAAALADGHHLHRHHQQVRSRLLQLHPAARQPGQVLGHDAGELPDGPAQPGRISGHHRRDRRQSLHAPQIRGAVPHLRGGGSRQAPARALDQQRLQARRPGGGNLRRVQPQPAQQQAGRGVARAAEGTRLVLRRPFRPLVAARRHPGPLRARGDVGADRPLRHQPELVGLHRPARRRPEGVFLRGRGLLRPRPGRRARPARDAGLVARADGGVPRPGRPLLPRLRHPRQGEGAPRSRGDRHLFPYQCRSRGEIGGQKESQSPRSRSHHLRDQRREAGDALLTESLREGSADLRGHALSHRVPGVAQALP